MFESSYEVSPAPTPTVKPSIKLDDVIAMFMFDPPAFAAVALSLVPPSPLSEAFTLGAYSKDTSNPATVLA